ncbi:MAG TPA: hypothetical protein PLB25_05005, partial [Rhodoferax sp.]|nr:hypothetical protein [Rhodoferax sp.]
NFEPLKTSVYINQWVTKQRILEEALLRGTYVKDRLTGRDWAAACCGASREPTTTQAGLGALALIAPLSRPGVLPCNFGTVSASGFTGLGSTIAGQCEAMQRQRDAPLTLAQNRPPALASHALKAINCIAIR